MSYVRQAHAPVGVPGDRRLEAVRRLPPERGEGTLPC